MSTRRTFLRTTTAAGLAALAPCRAGLAGEGRGTTFILVADTHYSSVDEDHPASHAMVKAINRIADGKTTWPTRLGGRATGFSTSGETIARPEGIVHLGDMTDFGSAPELDGGRGYFGMKKYHGFRQFWEHDGPGKTKVKYPVYCGLGNHDLDFGQANRERMWNYVATRHQGAKAPVPVDDFDPGSLCYSIRMGPVRILHLQRFATDTRHGRASGLPWLKTQLARAARSSEHVLLCQHYGFDKFGIQNRWWKEGDRKQLRGALAGHSNVIGLCHGHSHATGTYSSESLRVIRCNNMGWEINQGNKDGHGSFALVHATRERFDLVHVNCTAPDGTFAFRPHHHLALRLTG